MNGKTMDNEEEHQRFTKRKECFRGCAKVHLQHLRFEEQLDLLAQAIFLDVKNITRLEKVFDIEVFLRLDPEHHSPVVINDYDLEESCQRSGVASGELFTSRIPPALNFTAGYSIRCLHGRHRIAAAQNFLLAGDKWWTVDFYSERR